MKLNNKDKKHSSKSYVFLIAAFILCPCHLVLILPIISGTVIGTYILANMTIAMLLMTVFFLVFLLLFFLNRSDKQ